MDMVGSGEHAKRATAIKEAARPFIFTANHEDPVPAKALAWPAETTIIPSLRKWRPPLPTKRRPPA
jgi:hypothetical protein